MLWRGLVAFVVGSRYRSFGEERERMVTKGAGKGRVESSRDETVALTRSCLSR